MGDKSPKQKQRDSSQKKTDKDARSQKKKDAAPVSSVVAKAAKK